MPILILYVFTSNIPYIVYTYIYTHTQFISMVYKEINFGNDYSKIVANRYIQSGNSRKFEDRYYRKEMDTEEQVGRES